MKCQILMEQRYGPSPEHRYCNNNAKWETPKNEFGQSMKLCGIHKNAQNRYYKRIGENKECVFIKENN